MSRQKRSVSALLSNDEESITTRSSRKKELMVPCNCSKCNKKIVDVRTKLNHEANRDSDDDQDSEVVQDYSSNPLLLLSEDYGNPLPKDNPVSFDKDSDNN
ncbi:unnamed protein product [Rhizophagus irregularis]|nr:unnamed protein product [Rhizophagus irregularis]